MSARVVAVENRGLLFTDNPAGVSGVDAGYSMPVGAWVLWLFGDVFLLHPTDPAKPYVGGLSNAALMVPRGGVASLRRYRFLTDPVTGLARQVIPNDPGEGTETRLWPLGGVFDPKRRTAFLYYGKVVTTGTGPFDFRVVGHGLAAADMSRPLDARFRRLPSGPDRPLWWTAPSPLYGSAVASSAERDGVRVYVVGVDESSGRKRARLARVRLDHIQSPEAYEYYAGGHEPPRWSARAEDAADVEGLADFSTELSLAYNRYLGGWLAVHSVGIEPRIRLCLARQPWGPYSTLAEIGAPHRAFEKAFCYAGKEHPELAEDGGRVLYVTYVDSQRYWPQLLRVVLSR